MKSLYYIYSIVAVFIVCIVSLALMQYNYSRNIDELISGNKRILYELQVGNQLRELEKDMLSMESKIRGAVATDNISFLDGLELRITQSKQQMDSILKGNADDSTLANIASLYSLADEKLALKDRVIDSFHHGKILPQSFDAFLEKRMSSSTGLNDLFLKVFTSRQQALVKLHSSISESGKKARRIGDIMVIFVLTSEAILFLYIVKKILDKNKLIRRLNASEQKLQNASKVKENFIANMSHEIRTPLNAVLGFTDLLQKKNKQPELNEFIEPIQRSGKDLLVIINDILDLSKIEANMANIESKPFRISGIIHSVEILLAEKINEKGLQFVIVRDEHIPDTLLGDPVRLTQILMNLLSNAIKFTYRGEIRLSVKYRQLNEDNIELEFVISDTGIGIAKEKLHEVFERFIQAEDSITRTYGGTGLGLAIVKELIILQKGKIDVESELGKGTTFRFMIPYQIGKTPLLHIPPSEPEKPRSLMGQDINILVIEDNEMNQNLLRHLFNEWKFPFTIVNNGAEGIESLQAGKYDLILLDIQMPVMDGYTTAKYIREKSKLDIPIIAITAHAFASEREKCLSYGMNDHIAKPINERELRFAIIRAIDNVDKTIIPENKTMSLTSSNYKLIDLQYLYDISNGNNEYEKLATEQFLEVIPKDIESLESAYINKDIDALRKIAHNMKTNVSAMGLNETLLSFLNEIEYEPFDKARSLKSISSIKVICSDAMSEAQHFYSTL